jgi:hypothetical protein
MKKSVTAIAAFALLILLNMNMCFAEVSSSSIKINGGKTLYLSVNDYVSLDVDVTPDDADTDGIKFTSSKPEIAEVDYNGNITAKKAGYTTVTAELDGKRSSITVRVSEINKSLGADFTTSAVPGTDFVQITVTPHRYDGGELVEDAQEDFYYIYLPSGYFTEGKSASYVADRNGVYPFTVYYGSSKRTFYYTVKGIESTSAEAEDDTDDEIDFEYSLMYDYEKKQVIFNMVLDKVRTVITPDKKTTISNVVNYYLVNLKNSEQHELSVSVDGRTYDYRIIKQGEFYLLISLSPVDYDNHSTLVKYSGCNFTTGERYETVPAMDLFYDNGNYEVMIKSDSGTREIFSFNITDIDYRRPSVEIELLDDHTFDLDIEDDFGLGYIITFDGKYVPITKETKEFEYNHKTSAVYDGDYVFTVVDKSGNRTVAAYETDDLKTPAEHSINPDVHNYKYTDDLFSDIGTEYEKGENDQSLYEMILPSYMKGKSQYQFMPDSTITRAEIITLFCRITDLPYDTGAILKSKYVDIGNHWARNYIAMGSSKKYVSGYKDNTFRPESPVTRAEFCKMLSNISAFKTKLSSIPATSSYYFPDAAGHRAEKEILKISGRDIVTGKNGYFSPDEPITRSEAVHAVNKLYSLNPTEGEIDFIKGLYSKYYSFTDIANSKYCNDIIISIVGMFREKIN